MEKCEHIGKILDPDAIRHFSKIVEADGGNMRIMSSYIMEALRHLLRTKKKMEFTEALKLINSQKIPKDLLRKIPSKCHIVLIAVYNYTDMANKNVLDLEIVFFIQ